MGCMSCTFKAAHEGKSCFKASALKLQSAAKKLAQSHENGAAREIPYAPSVVHVSSLEVEPTYLARVHKTMWLNTDVKMKKLCQRACGSYA